MNLYLIILRYLSSSQANIIQNKKIIKKLLEALYILLAYDFLGYNRSLDRTRTPKKRRTSRKSSNMAKRQLIIQFPPQLAPISWLHTLTNEVPLHLIYKIMQPIPPGWNNTTLSWEVYHTHHSLSDTSQRLKKKKKETTVVPLLDYYLTTITDPKTPFSLISSNSPITSSTQKQEKGYFLVEFTVAEEPPFSSFCTWFI